LLLWVKFAIFATVLAVGDRLGVDQSAGGSGFGGSASLTIGFIPWCCLLTAAGAVALVALRRERCMPNATLAHLLIRAAAMSASYTVMLVVLSLFARTSFANVWPDQLTGRAR
jgi:hypothetical protein